MNLPASAAGTHPTSRRTLLTALAAAGVAAPLVSACGTRRVRPVTDVAYAASTKARSPGSADDGAATAAAIAAFTTDLYAGLAALPGNLVCSPYSVAVALAMTRPGAKGETAEQIGRVLHAGEGYAAGLSWLDRQVRSRSGRVTDHAGGKATISLDVANAVWGQRDAVWRPAYLDALATDFGTGVHGVDFRTAADDARIAINDWTADHTGHRIEHLLAPGALDASTRLVLVDAIGLSAPWDSPFQEDDTRERTFTRRDSSTVRVPMMAQTHTGAGYAEGPGWRAASLPYAGGRLAMAVVVPEQGRTVADVERAVAGDRLAALLARFATTSVDLRLPRWTARTTASLKQPLAALGMPRAFTDAADFSAMSDQRLRIDAVEHQAWIAVDEAGTEAAAATSVAITALSAPDPQDPQQVYAERPFLYAIYDVPTRTPLFVGRVDDPTAA